MNDHDPEVITVFCGALECLSGDERAAYLDEACSDDAELRVRVERLLRAHAATGNFLQGGPAAQAHEGPGALIGPYKLLEQIGEGGFGIVFMAEQARPIRRCVALKIVKPGMDTRQVVARFEAERQALALMQHPNIARVLDAGETASGRPYFVMELVRGVPITDFCDQNELTPRERLELFVTVCKAVQHAHQKGIIHRDLKPSNILVTLYDGTPVVKVIDFGIAKALGEQLTEKTLFTNFNQMVGTPRYMSPEQAERSGLDIDTRTDIYALGVLLYELLTGTTPLDQERMRQASYDELRRLIREEEPPRPSARITTLGPAATLVSVRRKSDPHRLSQLVRGELDWIVLKALEKDRTRRYDTASALAADVLRYLDDEPVLACPPSRWYRFRKFARRNKIALTMASIVVLAGVTTVAGMAVSNALIRQEQARTKNEQGRTKEEKTRAQAAQKLAEKHAEQIRHDLENLVTANALLERGRWYADETRWDDAYAAFTKAIELRPENAAAWVERANLFTLLGLLDLAAADLDREIELRPPDTTLRWYLHGLLRLHVGDEEGYRLANGRVRERFRGTTRTVFALESLRLGVLAPDPVSDRADLVKLAESRVTDRSWYVLYIVGVAQYRAGLYREAIERLHDSIDADPKGILRDLGYPILAMAHHRLGQEAEARQALEQAALVIDRWTQARYGGTKGHWVMHQGAAAVWPVAWWDFVECQQFYGEAKQLIDGSPPPDDPRLRVLRARAFAGLRWNVRADAEYVEALRQWPDDPQIRMEAHRSRGYSLTGQGRWSDAADQFDQACELAPDDAYLWRFRAVARLAAGEVDAYRRDCEAMAHRFETTADMMVACNTVFACVLQCDALADMARLVPLAEVAAPNYHFGAYVRGAALFRAGNDERAIRCFETFAEVYRPSAWDWSFLAMAHHRLGHAAEARHSLAAAHDWLAAADNHRGDDLTGTDAVWGDWHERVVYSSLVREAETLLMAPNASAGNARVEDPRLADGVP